MRACWEALHESLVRSATTLKADQQFKASVQIHAALARFEHPDSLVSHLTTRGGNLDEKDRIYEILVRAVQSRADWVDLATALLWLGLWPGLDAIYRYRLRDFIKKPEELVSEISFIFTTTVERIDLAGVRRLASTLVRNVERDVREGLKRRWADEGRSSDVTEHENDLTDGRPRLDDRELPVDPDNMSALREWLAGIVGDDADLVIGATLYGFDQHELADRLGISHEAARKRFQRTIKQLRERLGGPR